MDISGPIPYELIAAATIEGVGPVFLKTRGGLWDRTSAGSYNVVLTEGVSQADGFVCMTALSGPAAGQVSGPSMTAVFGDPTHWFFYVSLNSAGTLVATDIDCSISLWRML